MTLEIKHSPKERTRSATPRRKRWACARQTKSRIAEIRRLDKRRNWASLKNSSWDRCYASARLAARRKTQAWKWRFSKSLEWATNTGIRATLATKQLSERIRHLWLCCTNVGGVSYTVSGITKWLQTHDFGYQQPKGTPAKADLSQQEGFIEAYWQLVADPRANAPILFIDAVHPTMATKISDGWIKKGVNKSIATTASKTRVNIIGPIELKTMTVTSAFVETVNADSLKSFFETLRQSYPKAEKLHIILGQSRLECITSNSTSYRYTAATLTPLSDCRRGWMSRCVIMSSLNPLRHSLNSLPFSFLSPFQKSKVLLSLEWPITFKLSTRCLQVDWVYNYKNRWQIAFIG